MEKKKKLKGIKKKVKFCWAEKHLLFLFLYSFCNLNRLN